MRGFSLTVSHSIRPNLTPFFFQLVNGGSHSHLSVPETSTYYVDVSGTEVELSDYLTTSGVILEKI
jgi:hypothetical protein